MPKKIEIAIHHEGKYVDFSIPHKKEYDNLSIVNVIPILMKKERRPAPCIRTVYYVPTDYDYLKDLLLLLKKKPGSVAVKTDRGNGHLYGHIEIPVNTKIGDLPWRTAEDESYDYKTIEFAVSGY